MDNTETESEYSTDLTDDESLLPSASNDNEDLLNRSLSSPEDWDSDDYWAPHLSESIAAHQSPWLYYVKKKIHEGNFCPIDAHLVPIAEQVQYQKMCNPKTEYESDGQFDDFPEDNS